MGQVLLMTFLWLKAGHIIFAIFWMAGLFMLPRYFVYHQEADPQSPENAIWIEREARLRRIILTPSLTVVWALGLSLAYSSGQFEPLRDADSIIDVIYYLLFGLQAWFQIKLFILLLLSGYHVFLLNYANQLARGERSLSGKQLRLLNEVPGIAAALIVVLAVVRPF